MDIDTKQRDKITDQRHFQYAHLFIRIAIQETTPTPKRKRKIKQQQIKFICMYFELMVSNEPICLNYKHL